MNKIAYWVTNATWLTNYEVSSYPYLIAVVEWNANPQLIDCELKEERSWQLRRRRSLRQFIQHGLSGKVNL